MSNVIYLLDTLRADLQSLHRDDRLSGATRLLRRPDLLGNSEFRSLFNSWRLEARL